MKKLLLSQIALIVLLGAGVASAGENWPTWRGPDMNGIAPGGNPPLQWSETKNIKWKVKLGGRGDLSNFDSIVWQANEATPYVPSPLLYDGRLYVCDVNREVISCYDAKAGTPHFVRQKMDEIKGVYASPAAAAGRIYFVGRNGVSYVLKPSDKFEVLAVNTLEDNIDCSPAFVGDEMYLKGK